MVTKSIWHGAQTTLHCCFIDYDKLIGGEFYSDCQVEKKQNKITQNKENAEKLWNLSMKITKIEENNK